jgi:hypothetical protein
LVPTRSEIMNRAVHRPFPPSHPPRKITLAGRPVCGSAYEP